ncbi:MAG TPA: tyrosine--tRNA ligase [Candidatus Pacearchaeota archaeon]|nr:tyrosine--tRNA ligase [Candidatus Pacearchaeota archaeon]
MDKLNLIKRNLQEIIGEEDLKKQLKKKDFSVYWGTMPTGSISFAYFFPMLKIADFLKAGIKVKILLADLHAALDGVPWEILEKRYKYYERAIILILKSIGVKVSNLEFVKGSDIQLNDKYFNDLLKLSTLTSINASKHAASEAVKTARGDIKLSGLIYPLMQALDEEYLKVDAQFAGLDQRKILVFAREYLPKIGYKSRIDLMVPMVRGLVGDQMSSSVESSKIDLLDGEEDVIRKVGKAHCAEGNPENGLMDILKYLIFVMKQDKKEKFVVKRDKKYGGDIKYSAYGEVEKDFKDKKLHPADLKNAIAREINILLRKFRSDRKIKDLHRAAYK